MKVLLVAELNLGNSYIKSLYNILEKAGYKVVASVEQFWQVEASFDIVLIQWPEYLLENWRNPEEKDFPKLQSALEGWKKHSKIITTRHNIHPHKRNSVEFQNWYRLIYSYSSAIIHFGEFSKEEYATRYPSLYQGQYHTIIPHPLYSSIPTDCTREEARRKLNIAANKEVVLVFGKIRSEEEKAFIKTTFLKAKIKNKLLLCPSWRYHPISIKDDFWKALRWRLEVFRHKVNNKYRLTKEFVPDPEVKYYFQAADVVFLQRQDALNSGILPVAFQFGKVVVGAECGNIKEWLQLTQNPIYQSNNTESAAKALAHGVSLSQQGLGKENAVFASQEWNEKKQSEQYKSLIDQLYFAGPTSQQR